MSQNQSLFTHIWHTIQELTSELYSSTQPHIKFFFVVILISILFFCIWFVIRPYQDKNIYGVVPFPSDKPYLPSDNTLCGTNIVSCQDNGDCSMCNTNNYECTYIGNKNVYYLGTQLEKNKSYCLPKGSQTSINNCGTYTGKVVFGQNGWTCQCLYPDMFYDNVNCNTQVVCNGQGKLTNSAGSIWDPTNMPAELIGTTPYDVDGNMKPVFSCDCVPGYNTYVGDPYECHKDTCYVGSDHSDAAKFDKNSMQCICDNKTTYKSNISGFCYPYDNANICEPNPINGECRYGLDAFPDNYYWIVNMNGIPYMTYYNNTNYKKENGGILIDLSTFPIPLAGAEISNTQLKDTFNSYPIVNYIDLSTDDKNVIRGLTPANFISGTESYNQEVDKTGGVGVLCNSFFFKRDGYPNCDTISGGEMLNKTGSVFKHICNGVDCGPGGKCMTDITNLSRGWNCSCPPDSKTDPSSGMCIECTQSGNACGSDGQCCSDKCIYPSSCPEGNCAHYCL